MELRKRILGLFFAICITVLCVMTTPVEILAYKDAYPLPELTGDQAQDTANIAMSQLGYSGEEGTVYGAWWSTVADNGYNYIYDPWCAMFACWCAEQAGAGYGTVFDLDSAWTQSLFNFLQEKGVCDTSFTTDPQTGDFLFIGTKSGYVKHVAIVTDYNPETKIITVVGGNQGNFESGLVTQGFCTWKPDSPWGSHVVLGYGRPNYSNRSENDSNGPFMDVAPHTYYYEPVIWAVEKGITLGKSAAYFEPSGDCTRAQVVTFLWRMMGCPEPATAEMPFEDVEADTYFEKAVVWAYENGITLGTDELHFSPFDTVTRAEFVTFLWRLRGEPEPENTENPFEDVKTDTYYEKAVIWAYENGITLGKNATHFEPESNCLRAQVVTFLYRAYAEY